MSVKKYYLAIEIGSWRKPESEGESDESTEPAYGIFPVVTVFTIKGAGDHHSKMLKALEERGDPKPDDTPEGYDFVRVSDPFFVEIPDLSALVFSKNKTVEPRSLPQFELEL